MSTILTFREWIATWTEALYMSAAKKLYDSLVSCRLLQTNDSLGPGKLTAGLHSSSLDLARVLSRTHGHP